MSKKIVYVDMDNTICDYNSQMVHYRKLFPDVEFPQSELYFFSSMEPIDYALSCVAQLDDDPRYEVWFATAPSLKNLHCWSEKAKWILDHFGEDFLPRLIIAYDKSKLLGDYLIDDMDEGRGQDKFRGELIQIGTDKWENWIDITAYLLAENMAV